jgi:hypothetical protein
MTKRKSVDVNKEYTQITYAELKRLKQENKKLNNIGSKLITCLDFYANPETYFDIGFFPDPPNGEFMKDFSKTDFGMKPGKRARKTLDNIASMFPKS